MSIEEINKKIALIASEGYKDGNSIEIGKTYHIIPFPEFNDTPKHKIACQDEFTAISTHLQSLNIESDNILDIGSNVGFFSFMFNRELGSSVDGIELDNFSCDVASELASHYEINNVEFYNTSIDAFLASTTKTYNVVNMLNVHMWVFKQLGMTGTTEVMKNLANRTKHLYFQTAHKESSAMYIIEELKTEDDIKKHLESAGFTEVRKIRETGMHGKKRIMFHAKGKL